jgi:hypothetical protein
MRRNSFEKHCRNICTVFLDSPKRASGDVSNFFCTLCKFPFKNVVCFLERKFTKEKRKKNQILHKIHEHLLDFFFIKFSCGKWILCFLFTSCSSLIALCEVSFSSNLNSLISNFFTSCSTIVQSLFRLFHQNFLKPPKKVSFSFPAKFDRKL